MKTDEETALKSLFDVFSSVCSLEEVASAFSSAGGDVNLAGEILSRGQGTTAPADGFPSRMDIDIRRMQCTEFQPGNDVNESNNLGKFPRVSKPAKVTASTGIVSSFLGKEYYSAKLSLSERPKSSKPLKIELKGTVLGPGTLERTSSASVEENGDPESQETIDFLFSMLGDGFKLEKGAIKDVLGSCGYDAKKTMEYFVATASCSLDKGKAYSPDAQDAKSSFPALSSELRESDLPPSFVKRESAKLDSRGHTKFSLQREILESLFSFTKVPEDMPKRTCLPVGLNRTRAVGRRTVSAPLDDVEPIPSFKLPEVVKVEDEEDDYQIHRKAAKQNWEMMRTYYEAAVDAFTKGERGKADYLQEQGNFYLKMAQEANEKSAALVLARRHREDDFILDLREYRPKEAVKLLKFHLQSLAGIPSYRYIKVLLGANAGDRIMEKRRKLAVQFLETESIEWTEEAGKFCIEVSAIDPGKLSFIGNSQNY